MQQAISRRRRFSSRCWWWMPCQKMKIDLRRPRRWIDEIADVDNRDAPPSIISSPTDFQYLDDIFTSFFSVADPISIFIFLCVGVHNFDGTAAALPVPMESSILMAPQEAKMMGSFFVWLPFLPYIFAIRSWAGGRWLASRNLWDDGDEDWKIYLFFTSDNQNGMLEPPITCLSRTLGENDFILGGEKNVLIAIAISISVAAGGEKAVDGWGLETKIQRRKESMQCTADIREILCLLGTPNL